MPSSGERKLIQHLQEIFTQEQPKIHYKHETWTHSSGRKIEFDVWYSNMKITFEYNGIQHYKPSMFGYGNLKAQMQRDEDKQKLCKENGITLFIIPFWWDYKKESLIATIQEKHPELIHVSNSKSISIPSSPPYIHKSREQLLIDPSSTFVPVHTFDSYYINPVGK